MQGKMISIEGPDGAGKSTQIAILAQHLTARGYDVITMREPGGCPASETMRSIILNHSLDATTEMLLFAAQRAENMAKIIKPALEAGQIVISDRFHDSTYAYQGFGRQKLPDVTQLDAFALRGFEPHYTLFFDITYDESQRRLSLRRDVDKQTLDRFEMEERRFKERVYKGYQNRFRNNPHRMHRIDAMGTIPEVTLQVLTWLADNFEDRS